MFYFCIQSIYWHRRLRSVAYERFRVNHTVDNAKIGFAYNFVARGKDFAQVDRVGCSSAEVIECLLF